MRKATTIVIFCSLVSVGVYAWENPDNKTAVTESSEEIRRISNDYREQLEELDRRIAEKVREVKEATTPSQKEQLSNELKVLRHRARTLREEFRQKLHDLMGNGELPDGINGINGVLIKQTYRGRGAERKTY
ncbi:uncharacterized protein LOC135365981 isoform X2 [Ornithodoros turicata]